MKPLHLDIQDFPQEFDFYNDQFPPLDALTYWHFLKRANRVLEVGCGYSTLLPLKMGIELLAIDPSPRITYDGVPYLREIVQRIDYEVFTKLEQDDILFIDSSHIYESGSDVEYLIEEIIPILKEGVLVHFHDYFAEDGYPHSWKNDPIMGKWNENDYVSSIALEKIAFNYEISKHHNEELLETYPFVPRDITKNLGAVRGASLWLKK